MFIHIMEAGDGGAGGGVSLAGTWWGKEALALAEQVSESFDGDLKIYAFKATANLEIRVRIEKMSTRYISILVHAYAVTYMFCPVYVSLFKPG
jgi:hypothetical protein